MFECQIPGDPAQWTIYTKQGPPPIGFLNMQSWQSQIQLRLRKAWGNEEPLTGAVVLDMEFYIPWPDSAPQHRANAIENWYWKHRIMRPDWLNYFKAAEDACQGILFHNDSQVLRGSGKKELMRPTVYNKPKEGFTVIRFRPLERP